MSQSTGKIILLEDGWERVYKDGILKLQNIINNGLRSTNDQASFFTNAEFADLYTTIYQMCIQKIPHCFTPQLYQRFKMSVETYLRNTVLPAISSMSGQYMVQELVKRYADHKIMARWLCAFFQYLDRFYVKRHSEDPLAEVCRNSFCRLVFETIKDRLTNALLELIGRDRRNEEVDRELLANAIQIYVDMGLNGSVATYTRDFQMFFIQDTSDHYSRHATEWLSTDGCPEYLRKAEQRFAEERKRLSEYLHHSSEEPLFETLYRVLLVQHQSQILEMKNTGCMAMLHSHATDDLARMYSLYSRVPSSLPPIAKMVKQHIISVGQQLIDKVNAQKNHSTYVEELMGVHDKYYDLILQCFMGNSIFQKALKEAFENMINQNTFQCSTAELLSTYADNLLKKGGIRLEEKQLEGKLNNLVRLFSYLTDKDVFSEFYRKQLAKRLLLGRSASTDAEKSIIGKLKLRCGAQFTSKFEGMINDITNASGQHTAFQDWIRDAEVKLDLDFSIQTLTTGHWPTYQAEPIKLPPKMKKCLDAFRMYYGTKTKNRKLSWIHSLGTATLNFRTPKGKNYQLVLSTIQAAILMLFNQQRQWKISDLTTAVNLDADTIKRNLRTMASGKYKILRKKPSDGYKPNHIMGVNPGFTSQTKRIRVPNAAAKISKEDRKGANQAIQEDRNKCIEAAIVRTMKARQTLPHQKLILQVSQQLSYLFQPNPRQIKKRIEDLISREYLERDEDKNNLYHYLV